jgi:hypothetical protein
MMNALLSSDHKLCDGWSEVNYSNFLLYIEHFYIVLTLDIFEKDGGIKGRPVAGLAGKHKILV